MAIQKVHESLVYARNAGADLSEKVNYLAKIDTDGDLVLAAAATDMVIGNIIEGAIADRSATVQFGGIGKVIAGGSITAGDKLTSDGNGKAIATTSAGNRVFGVALDAADAGDIVSFVFARAHNATS